MTHDTESERCLPELRSLYEITGDIKDINTLLVNRNAIAAIEKDRAERSEAVPVAWQDVHDWTCLYYDKPVQGDVRPLYRAPPERSDVQGADERAAFEADAEPMGFDLTRFKCAAPEPWSEYADAETGHRWGGWLARASRPAVQQEGWVSIIDEWMHVPTLKLRAGEMTAQEVRTVIGVLGAIRAAMNYTEPPAPVLPCDVTIGNGTFRKGVRMSNLVSAAQRWHRMAYPDHYTLTDEEKDANLKRLQDCAAPPAAACAKDDK